MSLWMTMPNNSLSVGPFDCPTFQQLDVDPSSIDTTSQIDQANKWLSAFAASISSADMDSLIRLFHAHGYWRDILAFTWDMRTIRGHAAIRCMLDARLAETSLSALHLLEDPIRGPTIVKPLPDLVFIRLCFEFETRHGSGIAVAFLVPMPNSAWKAWSLLTRLGTLKGYPEKIGNLRAHASHYENWEGKRQREIGFEDRDPTVLIIGAGHSGLCVAARLTYLGVPALVIDRNKRVGDNWRLRYKSLRLHNTIWRNQMPYMDFPATWPVYCHASKLGDWLECYATALDLNVWLSSTITNARFSQDARTWQVSVDRDGKMRTMIVKHIIFATGLGGGYPKMPDVPGRDLYHGSVLHSTQFTSGEDYQWKKVIVVGACNSGHDVALDLYRNGCDVTMIQRSPTYVVSLEAIARVLEKTYNEHFPIEFADILGVALPFSTVKYLHKVSTARTANEIDKELLDSLATAGFRTYLGPDGAGIVHLVLERGGGLYINTGASQEIIKGNIKVKCTPGIRRFTERGVELEDGTVLEGDAVLFATGFGDMRTTIEEVCGPDVADKVGKVWGLDGEGELQGIWKRTGYPGLWIAMANLAHSRLHSLHLALQIKAIEEGIMNDETVYMG